MQEDSYLHVICSFISYFYFLCYFPPSQNTYSIFDQCFFINLININNIKIHMVKNVSYDESKKHKYYVFN
jgi:hypothetical protein